MNSYRAQLKKAAAALRKRFGAAPEVGIIFGSGLGENFFELSKPRDVLPFKKIPDFTSPTVAGHEGKIYRVDGTAHSVAVLQGRCHFYEGYSPERVVFPLRAFIAWGVRRWVITNACGALNPKIRPGDLVRISDHLNLTGGNPLRGPNLDDLGPRFPSLAKAYVNPFSESVARFAKSRGFALKSGVYVGIAGPSYETPAEIRAFRKLGGDLVGMSTVYEVIAAAHAGCEVTALSAVTNSCVAGSETVSHAEVLRNARRVDATLSRLLWEWVSGAKKKRGAVR